MPNWSDVFAQQEGVSWATRLAFDGKSGAELHDMAQAVPIPKGHVDAITAPELMAASGMDPYDWQLTMLGYGTDKWRLAAVSRQGGKSTVVNAAALESVSQKVGRVGLLLPSMDQAIDNLLDIRSFYFEALDKGFGDRMPKLLNDANERPRRLRFSNGAQIQAMSGIAGDLRTGRGATNRGGPMIRLIVDEAAFVLWEAVSAIVPALAARNGDVLVVSTVWVDFGWFYETLMGLEGRKDQFIVVRKTADEIPHISKDHLTMARGFMGEADFMREYHLRPTPLIGGLIPSWAIDAMKAMIGVAEADALDGWTPRWKEDEVLV